jgi:hypothetical protein
VCVVYRGDHGPPRWSSLTSCGSRQEDGRQHNRQEDGRQLCRQEDRSSRQGRITEEDSSSISSSISSISSGSRIKCREEDQVQGGGSSAGRRRIIHLESRRGGCTRQR